MKKLPILGASIIISSLFMTPALATVSNNYGSIVQLSASCQQVVDQVNGNYGSIIKVTGDGTCDANQLLESGEVSGNYGSIIKIGGVCGENVPPYVNGNYGSIIKISTVGACGSAASDQDAQETEVSGNYGSIIKVDTGGTASVNNNMGSIIKVDSGSHRPSTPAAPEESTPTDPSENTDDDETVVDNDDQAPVDDGSKSDSDTAEEVGVVQDSTKVSNPTELPQAGISGVHTTVLGVGVTLATYALGYILQRRH